jgi:hypothetical protein
MIRWNKGFGVGQSIILLGFLVFLMIPLFTFMTEKIYLKYVIHLMNEVADIAAMAAFQEIDANKLSSGDIGFSMVSELENRIIHSLEENTINGVKIKDCDVSIHSGGESCELGNTSQYDFIHLLIKVTVRRINENSRVQFYIHRDVEIPCIRME